jgi:prophage antirepressor-like protein
MDIIKAFQKNKVGINITIKGTHESPLFRASDIGEVLDISKIRNTIQEFDETEKVAHSMDTLGGKQEVTFLTEKGLYKVLFRSRKPIAKQFTDWVCEVIKEVRLNGLYNLEKQLELKDKKIDDILNDKDLNIIKNFENKPIVYLGLVENNIIKFGFTDNIKIRIKDHRKVYGSKFSIEYVYESMYNRVIEKNMKSDKFLSCKIFSKEYYGQNCVELIQLSDTFTLKDLNNEVIRIKNNIESYEVDKNKNDEIERLKKELEHEKLKNQVSELKSAMKPVTKPDQQIYSDYEINFIKFLKSFINEQEGVYKNMSKKEIYEKYEKFTNDFSVKECLYSYVTFNRKMLECPCVKESRVRVKEADLKDNRLHSFMISVEKMKLWLTTKEVDNCQQVDIKQEKEQEKEQNEKYYLLFLQDFIKNGGMSKRKKEVPKLAKNPFFCYCEVIRPEIKEKFPRYNSAQITTEIGKMWGELPESEKTTYVQKSEEDKKRYILDKENFRSKITDDIISVSNHDLFMYYIQFMTQRKYNGIYSDVSFSRKLKECPYVYDTKTIRKIDGKNTGTTMKNIKIKELENMLKSSSFIK